MYIICLHFARSGSEFQNISLVRTMRLLITMQISPRCRRLRRRDVIIYVFNR